MGPQQVEELLARHGGEVVVVDGAPHYHLEDCPALVVDEVEAGDVRELREDGFTACPTCRPDDALAQRWQTRAAADPVVPQQAGGGRCGACGGALPPSARFCGGCGTAVTAAPTSWEPATAAQDAAAVDPAPIALGAAAAGSVCAYCLSALDDDAPVCPACASPAHEECWAENGGCAVLGCAAAPAAGPAAAEPAAPAAAYGAPATGGATLQADHAWATAQPAAGWSGPPSTAWSAAGRTAAWGGSAYPQAVQPQPVVVTPGVPVMPPPVAPPGWYADPAGAGHRWWDGASWTAHVAP